MADNELTVTIGADPSKFQQGMNQVGQATEDLNNKLGQLAAAAGELFAAFELIAKPLEAFAREETSVNQLTQALKTQGIYTKELTEAYEAQAKAISEKTGIEESAIVSGQAMLQSLIGQKEITPELTKAVIDFANHARMDLASAFDMVGRSAFGSTTMLTRHGVVVNESLDANGRLAEFVKKVNEQFLNQSEAAAQGVGGLKLLSQAFNQLEVAIGARLAPTIESIAKYLTLMFQTLANNQTFVTFAQITLEMAAGLTALAGAMKLATVAASVLKVGVQGLVGSTGIGLLIVAAAEVYAHWSTVWPAMQKAYAAFAQTALDLTKGISGIFAGLIEVISGHGTGTLMGAIEQLKTALSGQSATKAWAEASKKDVQDVVTSANQMTQAQIAAGNRAEAERRAMQGRRLAAEKAERAVLTAEANNESKQMIAIKKQEAETLKKIADEKNANIRKSLQKHYQDLVKLEQNQQKIDVQRQRQFNNQILANDKEYQQMSTDQQQIFLLQHQQQLQSNIDTEQTALDKAAQKRAETQIESNNQYLQDQIKFGTAYAAINQVMHSEIYTGTKKAFGELAQLTQSSNSTLKSIGKVAALANIVIKTAESAMNIYEGFSTIPIIGPALGIAGAAAAVAYGAEQYQKVNSAAQGGLLTGGIPGVDSIPVLGMPGELVVPTKNFDEVVGAVADQRSGGNQDVVSLLKSIDSKLSQPMQTIIQGDVLADTTFIDALVRKISDAVRYRNARLVTTPAGS